MSGGNTATQSTTQGPPSFLSPYLNYALQQGTSLYQSPSPSYYPGTQVAAPSTATQAGWQDAIARATQGSAVGNAAQAYGTNVLQGGFLGPNPYQDAVNQSIYASTVPTVNAQFSLGGRYGSGAQQGTLGTAIANQIAPLEYSNYQQERANQQQMAGMAPSLGGQDWTDIQGLLGAGSAQDQLAQQQIQANMNQWNYNQNLAQNKLAQFASLMGGLPFGQTTTQQTTPAGSDFGSILASIGGGILGKVVGL